MHKHSLYVKTLNLLRSLANARKLKSTQLIFNIWFVISDQVSSHKNRLLLILHYKCCIFHFGYLSRLTEREKITGIFIPSSELMTVDY